MPQANLNQKSILVNDGLSAIVIMKDLADVPGGRTLDTSAVGDDVQVIRAGHIITYDSTKGLYAPLSVAASGDAYASLAQGQSYVGVLKASVPVADARAAILTMGQVNGAASPYPVTDAIKAALPDIQFMYV